MRKQIILFILLTLCFFPASGQRKSWLFQNKERRDERPFEKEDMFNVRITLNHYYPYCGGVYPTDDQMNDYQPENGSFLLIDLESGEKRTVVTEGAGIIQLNLKPGRYGLKETFKDCSFDDFMKRFPQPDNDTYLQTNPDCYKNWWASNFMEFTVTAVETQLELSHTFFDQCFIGYNPCLIYTGPYPP